MNAEPCKSCGRVHARIGAERPQFYARVLRALDVWKRSASLGSVGHPPEFAIINVRSDVLMLLADDQGLCVACRDQVVWPEARS